LSFRSTTGATLFFIWLQVGVFRVVFLIDSAWSFKVFVNTSFWIINTGECAGIRFD
jgi:hypothetical protein